MQEADQNPWGKDSILSPAVCVSLRELNRRFLNLVPRSDAWSMPRHVGLAAEVSALFGPLTEAQRAAAADCPYALFDLRFMDETYWLERFADPSTWRSADQARVSDQTITDGAIWEFVQRCVYFAWHLAVTDPLAARLLLGMSDRTAALFRAASVDCLPALASSEAANLAARWCHQPSFWRSLARTASRADGSGLRVIQLYGLQLAAATHLA